MRKKLLPLMCMAISLTLLLTSFSVAVAAPYPAGDVGGVFASQIDKALGMDDHKTGVPLPDLPWQKGAGISGLLSGNAPKTPSIAFMRFFLLNYVNGYAQVLFEDGTMGWIELSEDIVNALWGRCSVLSLVGGAASINPGNSTLLEPPLQYGLLGEDMTVNIGGVDVTFKKGSIVPVFSHNDGNTYIRMPDGTLILLPGGKFTPIDSPHALPESEYSESIGPVEVSVLPDLPYPPW